MIKGESLLIPRNPCLQYCTQLDICFSEFLPQMHTHPFTTTPPVHVSHHSCFPHSCQLHLVPLFTVWWRDVSETGAHSLIAHSIYIHTAHIWFSFFPILNHHNPLAENKQNWLSEQNVRKRIVLCLISAKSGAEKCFYQFCERCIDYSTWLVYSLGLI